MAQRELGCHELRCKAEKPLWEGVYSNLDNRILWRMPSAFENNAYINAYVRFVQSK